MGKCETCGMTRRVKVEGDEEAQKVVGAIAGTDARAKRVAMIEAEDNFWLEAQRLPKFGQEHNDAFCATPRSILCFGTGGVLHNICERCGANVELARSEKDVKAALSKLGGKI